MRTEIVWVSADIWFLALPLITLRKGRTIRWCQLKYDQLLALLVQDQSTSDKLPGREVLFALNVVVVARKPQFPVKDAQEQASLCLGEFGCYQLR